MPISPHDLLGAPSIVRSRASSPHPASEPSFAALLDTSGTSYKAHRDKTRSRLTRPPSRPSNASVLERISRRPKLFGVALIACFVVWALWSWFGVTDLVILFRFKLRDLSFEEGWTNGCGLRKRPLLFVHGERELAVVWETNCRQDFVLRWGVEVGKTRKVDGVARWTEARVKRTNVEDVTNTHWAYRAVLKDLHPGSTYAYQIVLGSSPPQSSVIAHHSFPWLGASPSSPSKIHLSIVSDNQYNVRVFHRILLSLLSFSPRPPSLLLHLGDVVQNPHNLAQWQTDFYDPMTSLLRHPFGQSTPILLARGNHDWDLSGNNTYTGGSPPRTEWVRHLGRQARETSPHPGTYMAYSPHPRCRMLVLDANLDEVEQREQEEWLGWELKRPEWRRASLRIVLVHAPPFLEYWDHAAWNHPSRPESQWSVFVRHRLTPLLSIHSAHVVISGHQHAYSRGFLPTALHHAYTTAPSSSILPAFALSSARERGWTKTPREQREPGTVYAIVGGAGGSLDEDLVEDWGFYEASVKGKYHFVDVQLEFEATRREDGQGQKGWWRRRKGKGNGSGEKVYRVGDRGRCVVGEVEVLDVLEWKAVGLDRKVFDAFRIEAEGCRSRSYYT